MGRVVGLILPALYAIALTAGAIWYARHRKDPLMPGQPSEQLVQVGWYCWRCHGIVTQACRSDNVPVHVPADWVDHMVREIEQRENGDFD